ncbi:MAG TPA: L,D-transpeptidase [Polyangiaceae bacterium]|nr:L,D-transpeptidase [Polyangiaceae bacterium]
MLAALALTLASGCRRFEARERKKTTTELDASYFELFPERSRRRPSGASDRAPPAKRKLYATARFVWIRKKPTEDADWLGYVSLGEELTLRSDDEVPGGGVVCRTWVPVEPEGWVCLGRDATLDADDPLVRALSPYRANVDAPYPFEYARSLEAPRYRSLPTLDEQKKKESSHLDRVARAKNAKSQAEIASIDRNLVGVDLGLTGAPAPLPFTAPFTVLETDEDIPYGSTVAYAYAFDLDERAFAMSWDHAIVPMTHLRRYPRSAFHGVTLDADLTMPLAFARKTGARRFHMHGDRLEPSSGVIEPRTAVALTGRGREVDGVEYVETAAHDWAMRGELVIPARAKTPPKGLSSEGRGTWVEVSTIGGWLVAYERDRPVFATLISAGRGDLKPDKTMNDFSSTPPGTYAIANKLKTATMRTDRRPDSVHAEVMYTQVFHGGFALHGAYWHDDFGERKSAGCVNLSPRDAKWLFDWSEPNVPNEWHAKRTAGGEPATLVVIHP